MEPWKLVLKVVYHSTLISLAIVGLTNLCAGICQENREEYIDGKHVSQTWYLEDPDKDDKKERILYMDGKPYAIRYDAQGDSFYTKRIETK